MTTAQNGPGTAVVTDQVFDAAGHEIWSRDGDGFLRYTQYDAQTGAVVKSIVDVDTSRTSDFQNLPSGWATPAGGELHLVTTHEVDQLGRITKAVDGGHQADWSAGVAKERAKTNRKAGERTGAILQSLTRPLAALLERRSPAVESAARPATPHDRFAIASRDLRREGCAGRPPRVHQAAPPVSRFQRQAAAARSAKLRSRNAKNSVCPPCPKP